MTAEERKAVEEHVRAILMNTTHRDLTVSGHDQDWDDYVHAVNAEARRNLVKPRLFEYYVPGFFESKAGSEPTGQWKDLAEVK